MSKTSSYKKVMIHCMTGKNVPPARSLPAGVQDYATQQGMTEDQLIAEALNIVSRRLRSGPVLTNPKATRDFLTLHFAGMDHELFTIVYLNNRHAVLGVEDLFRGTIDGASVHPRIVVKRCLEMQAAACILAHNHPSGEAEPSRADELITRRLKSALELIEVRVLDHLVIGGARCESFAERGIL